MALARRLFRRSGPIMDRGDLIRFQVRVLELCLVAFFLPAAPLLLSVAAAGALLLAAFSNTILWSGWGFWPPAPCAVVALMSLTLFALRIRDLSLRRELWQLLAISLVGGVLGLLRRDCFFFMVVPFAAICAFSVLALSTQVIHEAISLKKWALPVRDVRRVLHDSRFILKIGVIAALVVLSTMVIPKVLSYLNIRLFEIIEQVEHQPRWEGHPLWHNLYIGIGGTLDPAAGTPSPHNAENITWNDLCGFSAARQASPTTPKYSPAYFEVLREQYMTILHNNPADWFEACFAKAKHLLFYLKEWLLVCLVSILMALAVGWSRRDAFLEVSLFLLSSAAIFLVCLAPPLLTTLTGSGFLTVPLTGHAFQYAVGVHAAVITFPPLSAAFLATILRRDRMRIPEEPDVYTENYRQAALRGLMVVCVAVIIIGFCGIGHIRNNYTERRDLATELAAGRVSINSLLQSYHATAVHAFNTIPEQSRHSLLAATMVEPGNLAGCSVSALKGDSDISLVHARWIGERVFVFLRCKRPLHGSLIPLHIAPDSLPQGKNAHPTSNAIILLPTALRPGTWLFSFAASTRATDIQVGTPVPGKGQPYGKPIAETGWIIERKPRRGNVDSRAQKALFSSHSP
jgi:hypothetical protein